MRLICMEMNLLEVRFHMEAKGNSEMGIPSHEHYFAVGAFEAQCECC